MGLINNIFEFIKEKIFNFKNELNNKFEEKNVDNFDNEEDEE